MMSGTQKAMDIVVIVWVAVIVAFTVFWLIISCLTCLYGQMDPSLNRQILRTIVGLYIGLWYYKNILR